MIILYFGTQSHTQTLKPSGLILLNSDIHVSLLIFQNPGKIETVYSIVTAQQEKFFSTYFI